MSEVGIDDIAIHFPKLYLDMKDFAEMRDADYGKLNKGLGLSAMAIPDVHEDTATMGANAVTRLIDRNGIKPIDDDPMSFVGWGEPVPQRPSGRTSPSALPLSLVSPTFTVNNPSWPVASWCVPSDESSSMGLHPWRDV